MSDLAHNLLNQLNPEKTAIVLSALQTLSEHGLVSIGPFAQLLGITFSDFGNGKCTASLQVSHHLLNPLGIAHGGVTFALADSACGGAAFATLHERRCVTQDLQIRYHGPARLGEIIARAETLYKGSRTLTTQCRVTQNEVLIASATGTFAILSDDDLKNLR